jgi:hypothetical protein
MAHSGVSAFATTTLSLLLLVSSSYGLRIPLNNTHVSKSMLASACQGQEHRKVCHPFHTSKYIKCGRSPNVASCKHGKLFDYTARACKEMTVAKPCPQYMCPASNGAAILEPPYGHFGQPGNVTLNLTKADNFRVFCPINGHCLGGLMFDVEVSCPAPPDRYPYTFMVDWEEVLTNSMTYPERHADLNPYCGDKIFIKWSQPIHLVDIFNTSYANYLEWQDMLVFNYPPQPVYKCPSWVSDNSGVAIPNPGDVVLPNGGGMLGPANTTWTANTSGTFWIVCPVANHCALGMFFKLTVKPLATGHVPTTHHINWGLTTYDLYEDMTVHVGDSLVFQWGAVTFHGVFVVQNITSL